MFICRRRRSMNINQLHVSHTNHCHMWVPVLADEWNLYTYIYIDEIAKEESETRSEYCITIDGNTRMYLWIHIYDRIDPSYVSIDTHTVICMHWHHHFAIKKKVDSPLNTVEFIWSWIQHITIDLIVIIKTKKKKEHTGEKERENRRPKRNNWTTAESCFY